MFTTANSHTSFFKRGLSLMTKLLSCRITTFLIIFTVIASRIIQLVYYYNIYVDASYQVMGTQSLLDGHGVSTPNVLHSNLSETIYTPLINWPPGYSLLFAPFFRLFNYNYIAAGITIDILFAIILMSISRGILKLMEVPLHLRNCFTLLTGFFIYYFYFNQCSDAIAITFLLLSLYFTLRLLKEKKNTVFNSILLALFLCLAAVMKYLFIPVAFVIPIFLLIKGVSNKNNQVKKTGLYTFAILAVFVASLLVYQKQTAGSATYISSPNRGFYPENLLKAYPTFPASFIKPGTLAEVFPEKADLIYHLSQIVYIIFLLVLIGLLCKKIVQSGFKNLSLFQSFLYISSFLSLSIITLLTFLSLTVEKEAIFSWYLWTYVEDGRYYGLINVLLHLGVFILFQFAIIHNRKRLKFLCFVFLILMIPEMFRGLYFDFNRIKKFNKEEYSWQYEQRLQQYAETVIRNKNDKSLDKIVVTGTAYNLNHRVVINSHVPPLTDVNKINNFPSLNTSTPVMLLAILQKDSLDSYKPFTSQKEVKLAGSYEGFNFYTVYVNPH